MQSTEPYWPAGETIPEPGQVWRQKRKGRLVTVINPAARVGETYVDVSYDVGKGRMGWTASPHWHSTFELTDEDSFAHVRSLPSPYLRRLVEECEASIAARAMYGGD